MCMCMRVCGHVCENNKKDALLALSNEQPVLRSGAATLSFSFGARRGMNLIFCGSLASYLKGPSKKRGEG